MYLDYDPNDTYQEPYLPEDNKMFTERQLDLILFAARKTKNQGELAVYKFLNWGIWSNQQWYIIRYCAEECKRQRSGEMSVYDMIIAWNYAIAFDKQYGMPASYKHPNISTAFINHIGRLVEPHDNKNGFRTIQVGVQQNYIWHEKAPWANISRLLEHLIDSYYDGYLNITEGAEQNPKSVTAEDEFYYNYEEIHPFQDGNGRSGKILYNYLSNTLENPIMPPNFWGGSNP